ncbi:MAG: hypothetical protein K2X27_02465 [Candidatus Obscuribacterales bacterium]|nr:hypothetical protein [Candidatus Obscuribacterales bacterium]
MSGSGKNLQEIYDAGTKRLEELEQSERAALSSSTSQAVEDLGKLESSMMSKMDRSLEDLEAEVRAYLNKAVENIDAVVSSEVDENRMFLERLKEALKLSCKSLSEDVKQLKESINQRFDGKAENARVLHQRELEKGLSLLKTDGTRAAADLKDRSQKSLTEFSSAGSSHLLQVLDRNTRLPAEIFAEFSRNALSIDKRINDCVHLLSSRSKEILLEFNAGGTGVQSSLEQIVQQLAQEMNEVYNKSDAELRKHCEDALSAALLFQDQLSRKISNELQESHNLRGSGISEKLETMKSETSRLLEQVKQFLEDVDTGVRHNCVELSATFDHSLKERLEEARLHSQHVADVRKQLMASIGDDLRGIEADFEKRLTELASTCQTRLSAVCADAEIAIISAHDSCAADFKSLSSQQRKAIEDRTQSLLSEVEALGERAIQSIKAAAGDNARAASGTSAAPPASDVGNADNLFGDFGDLKL